MGGRPLGDDIELDCRLGRIKLLQRVYEHVRDADPPCVIGIHGDWGAGKTSFLAQLEALLTVFRQHRGAWLDDKQSGMAFDPNVRTRLQGRIEGLNAYPVVWFEAWRYQHDPQPVITLLREIRRQLSPARRAATEVKKIGAVAIETGLVGIDGVISKFTGFKAGPKEIRESGERYEAENFMAPSATVSLTDVLDQAIAQVVLPRNKKVPGRLVVIIDDLDRCSPETAKAMLEGLKVFLQLRHVVFVIAMDESVVADFIAMSFKDSESEVGVRRRRARQYIEKLCQSIYRLPFAASPENLFIHLLTARCREGSAEARRAGVLGEKMVGLNVVPPNPRRIKILADVTHQFLETAGDSERRLQIAYVLAYCYRFAPEIYRLIERDKEVVYNEVLVGPITNGETSHQTVKELVLPQKYRAKSAQGSAVLSDLFPDPIRDDVFYPAELVELLGPVTRDEIEAIIQ